MEEDIEILKKIKEQTLNASANACTGAMSDIWRKEARAIENILNRLEQDERVIEEMAEYIRVNTDFTVVGNAKGITECFRKRVDNVE